MSHFNICPDCIHRNYCVLTAQKDNVWSCSEFDAFNSGQPNQLTSEQVKQPEQELVLV
ncbi:hypothetical protein [Olleya namhaensis]|uniref:Uncharacterized protein n=1 Tax=Olleya namhaensis TaxID=1144750 RepID=A0A1I3MQ85_9FLAO|nr:hypothetical protein [Olleya namhaensis]SFI99143.1 hypothetical protein SAMN05443431_103257 [Olleya namhaensis]